MSGDGAVVSDVAGPEAEVPVDPVGAVDPPVAEAGGAPPADVADPDRGPPVPLGGGEGDGVVNLERVAVGDPSVDLVVGDPNSPLTGAAEAGRGTVEAAVAPGVGYLPGGPVPMLEDVRRPEGEGAAVLVDGTPGAGTVLEVPEVRLGPDVRVVLRGDDEVHGHVERPMEAAVELKGRR